MGTYWVSEPGDFGLVFNTTVDGEIMVCEQLAYNVGHLGQQLVTDFFYKILYKSSDT